jgi:phosphate:Na+ symporter
MKTSIWQRIPGASLLFRSNPASHAFSKAPPKKVDSPKLSNAVTVEVKSPTVFYSEAELASGVTRCPTHLLYPTHPTSVSDIVGKAAAPYYDAFHSVAQKIFRRRQPVINPVTAPAQSISMKEALIVAGTTAAGLAACGSKGDLSDALVSAVVFNLAGGLALFVYGMKIMDNGLKAAAGKKMKYYIQKFTGNRFSALLVGAGVTTVIQSSSVTTVISLGLVDAGLMNLAQAMGIVAGANIGTTMTGWLFAIKATKYGLPMMAAALLTKTIAKSDTLKNVGTGIFGLGMVFLGLTTMSQGFKDPVIKETLTDLFSTMGSDSIWQIAGCIALSGAVTALIQSSSATLGITIALANKGIIPFETAVALVLGSNIGTTITAWFAAFRSEATTEGKRVAIAHSLFNFLGVLAIWPWCPAFADFSKKLANSAGIPDDPGIQVAFVHTLFNISASVVFLSLLDPFKRTVEWLAPDKKKVEEKEEGYGVRRLSKALLKAKAPKFALMASNGVISGDMKHRAEAMFEDLRAAMNNERKFSDVEPSVMLSEVELDRLQENLYGYFNRLEQEPMDREDSTVLDSQRHITGNLESIGDNLLKLMLISKKSLPEDFPEQAREYLILIHKNVMDHFMLVNQAFFETDSEKREKHWSKAQAENDRIKKLIAEQEQHVVQGSTKSQIFYSDAVGLYRELTGNIKNIAEALAGKK